MHPSFSLGKSQLCLLFAFFAPFLSFGSEASSLQDVTCYPGQVGCRASNRNSSSQSANSEKSLSRTLNLLSENFTCTTPGVWRDGADSIVTIGQNLTGLREIGIVPCTFAIVITPQGQTGFHVQGTPLSGDLSSCQSYTEDLIFHNNCGSASGTFLNSDGGSGMDTWTRLSSPENPVLELSFDKQEVYPRGTNGSNAMLVTASLSGSPEVLGKIIQFSSVSKEFSGGHQHSENRPTGTYSSNVCTTDVSGRCSVSFTASEISGVEILKGTIVGVDSSTVTKELTVKVPGLIEVGLSNFYRLTGYTAIHQFNHFIAPASVGIIGVASDFYDTFDATLGLNDMSLEQGGLFDIEVPWIKPHSAHRVGRSADIDKCAVSRIRDNPNPKGSCANGSIAVPKRLIGKMCNLNGGHLVVEGPIHCEF